MNYTEDMRDAAWELKLLTASDPAATSNMMRHVAALALMVAGRRQPDQSVGEPEIAACFLLDHADRNFFIGITAETGIDQILVGFDVDDAAGEAQGFGVVHAVAHKGASFSDCRLWAPANGGRAVLVPQGVGSVGYFAFRKGGSLRHVGSRPAADLEPGFRRAAARYARLAASPELHGVGREGYLHVISNDNGMLRNQPKRLAA